MIEFIALTWQDYGILVKWTIVTEPTSFPVQVVIPQIFLSLPVPRSADWEACEKLILRILIDYFIKHVRTWL